MWWLLPPYGAKIRRRQALAELRRWQAEERAAAKGRLLGVAAILDGPTAVHPVVSPLLTPGQAARADGRR
jgi:hypothetical protein